MKHCFYGAHVVVPEYHLSTKCPRIIRPNSGYRHGKKVVISSYEALADAMMDGHVRPCPLCAKGKLYNVMINDMQRQVWLSERDHVIFLSIGKLVEAGAAVMPKTVAADLNIPRQESVKSFNLLQKMGLISRGHNWGGYGSRKLSPVGAAVYEMYKYNLSKNNNTPLSVVTHQKL